MADPTYISGIPQPYRSLVLSMVDEALATAAKAADGMYTMLQAHIETLAKLQESPTRTSALGVLRQLHNQDTFMDLEGVISKTKEVVAYGSAFSIEHANYIGKLGSSRVVVVTPVVSGIAYRWRKVSGGKTQVIENTSEQKVMDGEELYGPYVAFPGVDPTKPMLHIGGSGVMVLQGDHWFVLPGDHGLEAKDLSAVSFSTARQTWGPYLTRDAALDKIKFLRHEQVLTQPANS